MPKATRTNLPLQSVITHNDIAQRAYDIYVQTGFRGGQCQENWQRAEEDLRQHGRVACVEEHRVLDVFAPDSVDALKPMDSLE